MEGQANAVPLSSVAPPTVANATFAAGVTVANTTGGTQLFLSGVNLGPSANFTQVVITVPAGDVAVLNCTVTQADTALQCPLPVASGRITRVAVTALGQQGAFVPTGLAYAPPSILSASPTSLPSTGATVTLTGVHFGNALSSVVVLVNGVPTLASMPVSAVRLKRPGCSGCRRHMHGFLIASFACALF